ncbi:MAG: hypothetical protein CR974_01240 [Gammaproteobacteria bacterium]|nr:MAG: hypothetical protein CR974_01240 [Gammaproteobacteria bacterium]
MGTPETIEIPYPPQSLEGLAVRWLQWAASIHANRSAIDDTTGQFAHLNQPEDVWFLAGCFGGRVSRTCTIPPNTKIFLPAVNEWFDVAYQDIYGTPDVSKLYGSLSVDGIAVELDEIFIQNFIPIKGVWGNPVNESAREHPFAIYGLWKLLEPLARGEHEIIIRGGGNDNFEMMIEYQITVAG